MKVTLGTTNVMMSAIESIDVQEVGNVHILSVTTVSAAVYNHHFNYHQDAINARSDMENQMLLWFQNGKVV